MPSILLPVGDWAPDAAPYMNSDMPTAKNTYPRADGSDGPMQGPVTISNALASAPRGAIAARDNTGTAWVVAGTTTKLYVQSGLSWVDRSGAATFAVPTGGHWRFTQFGERVIGTNYADNVQTHTLGSGANFADLSAGAPKAKYIASVEPGFVMLGFYSSGGVQSNGVWWSGLNDATSWPTLGTAAAAAVQSDNNILPGGGAITGILPAIGGSSAVIFTERSLYRIDYVGPPQIFSFREVDRSRGCIAPQSIVQVGPLAYFLSEDGFCVFNGATVENIGAGKVDQFFLTDLDQTALERVYGTVDAARKLVIWAYPSTSATSQTPNRWLVFSYATGRWRYGDDAAMSVQYMFPARTAGYNLDTLDTVLPGGPDASGGFTVDSPLYQGGTRVLAGFDTSNRLVSFSGSNLAARLETGDADVEGSRLFIRSVLPLTDASAVTAGVGWRSNFYDTLTYTTPTAQGLDNRCPQRVSAQYARAYALVAAGASWSRFQGMRVDYRKDGER